ncbi:hypothetical protein ACFPRL_21830 [Pseudoclavibacter helvolus]
MQPICVRVTHLESGVFIPRLAFSSRDCCLAPQCAAVPQTCLRPKPGESPGGARRVGERIHVLPPTNN